MMMQQLMNLVVSGKEFSAEEMTAFLEGIAGEGVLEETTVKLLYRYYASQHEDNTEQGMNIEQLFRHLSEKMANDDLYADLIDDDMRSALEDA